MDFSLSREVRDVIAFAAARLAEPTPPSWAEAVRLGWFDDELGLVERALLAAEFGRALLPLPWWNALSLPCELGRGLAQGGEGAVRPIAVLTDGVTVTGEDGAGGARLTAGAAAVDEVSGAEVLLVGCAEGVFRVAVGDPGVDRGPADRADPLRGPSTVRLDSARGERLEAGDLEALTLRRDALTAAEAVGVARWCYRTAVAHVTTRTQFGRPVGSYQGVAFAVADSFTRLELAWSMVLRAAWAVDHGAPDARSDVQCAVLAARRAAVLGAEQTIQALGGIGMTWEHPVHHWYRRALWADRQGGSTQARLEALAAALLPARS